MVCSCLYCQSTDTYLKKDVWSQVKMYKCRNCHQEFVMRGVTERVQSEKKKSLACVHCQGERIQKNGKLTGEGQRYRCLDCLRHFTIGGIRGSYSDAFKKQIAEFYVKRKISARTLSKRYGLSTSSIVQWGKMYRSNFFDDLSGVA